MARVPLMPTSQSLSERQTAAFASGIISSFVRNCSNAERIDSAVIDCSQSRRIGFLLPVEFDEITENQFAFAAGVAGVDQVSYVFALDQSS